MVQICICGEQSDTELGCEQRVRAELGKQQPSKGVTAKIIGRNGLQTSDYQSGL